MTTQVSNNTSFVGDGVIAPGTTIMFCNGINNPDIENAKDSATIISNAFGGRRVEIFHNPTSFGNIFDHSSEEMAKQTELSALFVKAIQQQVETHRKDRTIANKDIRILLFAHSHGVKVLNGTLGAVPDEYHQYLHIFSFGGAQLIQRIDGKVVENYVHENDRISDFGNILTSSGDEDSQMALYNIRRINEIMSQGKTFEEAIYVNALEELKMHLSPCNSTDKYDRFHQIFLQRNAKA